MESMKSSAAIVLAAGTKGLIWFGARGSARKTAPEKRTLVHVQQMTHGVVEWTTPDGELYERTRTGTPVWVEKYEGEK